MKLPRASVLIASILLADIATAAATCYRLDGTPFAKIRADDGDWVPCDASATVSSCCSVKDYCLGNGLCLDAGANNYFSIQGCTDATWGSPCITSPACKSNIRDGYSFVWACGQVTNSTYNYCCGASPSCCSTPSSLMVIPAVTSIDRPSPATETPVTATITVAASSGSSGPDGKILAIGLGAGLGTGLLLLGAILVCFIYQSRRKARQAHHRGDTVGAITASRTGSRPVLGDDYDEDKNRGQDPAPATSMPIMPVPVPSPHARTMHHQVPLHEQQQQQQYHQQTGYATARYPELEGRNFGAPSPASEQWNSMGHGNHEAQQMSRNTNPGGTNANAGWYGGASQNSHP